MEQGQVNGSRVGIYARVSTADQHASNQLEDLRRYAGARGWKVVGEFVDEGVSGAQRSRPGLDALMKLARRRRVDTVLVFKYDRFARSMSHLLQALEEFKALNINFVSLSEGVDTTTAMGKFIFGVFSSLSEFERDLIASRVKHGMEKARQRGRHLGRPRLKVDADRVRLLRSQGLSIRKIAAEIGVSKSTVATVLS